MKKEVTYYLEDPTRLNEISQSELNNWIAEMPFHQPLHMLAGMKAKIEGHRTDDSHKVYAAHFAEDYEIINKKQAKNKNQRNKNTKQLATTIDIQPKKKVEKEKVIAKKGLEVLPEISHDLADDVLEESVSSEILEIAESTQKEILSSDLANDLLEDNVISEVLEENIEEIPPLVIDANQKDSGEEKSENAEEIQDESIIGDQNDENLASLAISEDVLQNKSKVDYSEYTKIVDLSSDSSDDATDEQKLDSKKNKPQKTNNKKDDAEAKSRKLKSKKLKIKKKIKKKVKKKVKKKKDSSKRKSKDKALKQKEQSSKKKKKNKSKKENKKKKKKKSGIVGKVHKRKGRRKEKKEKKNVKYIIVDSSKEENFKLNDYDGVSSYTSWLLEQDSINTSRKGNIEAKKDVKKSKKKPKKKKKESKSLKVATDSIKKQDSIISEPLANILALQGHKKKARKMYSKLAFVFPEKKAYFEEKIESLK